MEYDPFYGSRTYRDRGANLPEPVHIPGEHHQQNNQHYYELDPQHGSQVSPPNNAPQDKPDIGPSTNDSPKPVHTLNTDETANSGGRRISRRCTRKRVVIPIALLLTIVAIGAVLGGVLGTMLSAKQAPADNSPYFSPDNGDTLLGSKSQLANSFSKSAHVIVAQNEDGELMAVEFHGSKTDRYLLKNHTYDTELPNALGNTPLELVQFGSEEDLHLFYFDHAFRLAHVVRTNKDGRDVWTPGALMDGHLLSEPPADTVRLSVCVMSSDWSESGDSYLLVVYQMDNGEDGMVLLASSDPGSSESWNTHYFVMNTDELGESMNNESSGFLILPTTREKDDEMLPALRILWDLSDDEEKATFGSVECEFGGGYNLTDCIRTKDDWAASSVEGDILDAAKPLSLSATTISSYANGTSTWLINIIDGDGKLTELRGTDEEWTESKKFKIDISTLPDGKKPTFSGVGSANEDLLYAVSDGKLMEFRRVKGEQATGEDGERWEFLGVIKTQ